MNKDFKENLLKQRERMKLTEKIIQDRIDSSPFGARTRELVEKWARYESYGGVGWGVFTLIFHTKKG